MKNSKFQVEKIGWKLDERTPEITSFENQKDVWKDISCKTEKNKNKNNKRSMCIIVCIWVRDCISHLYSLPIV